MFTRLKSLTFPTAHILLLLAPFGANAQDTAHSSHWPTDVAVQTKAGDTIPSGAFGVVQIETPRSATLLHLRGVAGRGIAIIKSDDNQDCLRFPIRFVAGDFGGDGISAYTQKPIRLIIQTTAVAKALVRGDDVVSDMYRTSTWINDANADIVIERGLGDDYGFVLNPGSSVFADILGIKTRRIACSKI